MITPWRPRGTGRLAGLGGVAYRAGMVRTTIGARVVGAVMVAAAGCADAPEYVEFAELCGEAGPVRLLELAPGYRLNAAPFKVGERVVYLVGRGASPQGPVVHRVLPIVLGDGCLVSSGAPRPTANTTRSPIMNGLPFRRSPDSSSSSRTGPAWPQTSAYSTYSGAPSQPSTANATSAPRVFRLTAAE